MRRAKKAQKNAQKEGTNGARLHAAPEGLLQRGAAGGAHVARNPVAAVQLRVALRMRQVARGAGKRWARSGTTGARWALAERVGR